MWPFWFRSPAAFGWHLHCWHYPCYLIGAKMIIWQHLPCLLGVVGYHASLIFTNMTIENKISMGDLEVSSSILLGGIAFFSPFFSELLLIVIFHLERGSVVKGLQISLLKTQNITWWCWENAFWSQLHEYPGAALVLAASLLESIQRSPQGNINPVSH